MAAKLGGGGVGMRGRKPKPDVVRELAGNPGKRAARGDEPQVASKLPRCPGHLSGEARREWRRVAHDLHQAGLLKACDRGALAAYCQAWADWVDANEHLVNEGKVLTTDKGYEYASPWVGIANAASQRMRQYMTEFGLTPSARVRLRGVETTKKELSLAEMLFQMAGGDDGKN